MKRIGLVVAAVGALLATPGWAQDYKQPVVQRDTVPVQISQKQVRTLQRTLNSKGFSAGAVDGLWGDNTAAALKRFQAANQLNPTGELDRTTELKLGMIKPGNRVATPVPPPATPEPAVAPVAVVPVSPAPVGAAPTSSIPANSASATSGSATPAPSVTAAPPAAVVIAPVQPPATSAASTDRQPKATSGANSFTEGQAHDRIQSNGYQDVHNLTLDSSGIWRGLANKNGQSVRVWMDYQGDVGQQ